MKLCYLIVVLSLLFPANIFAHELPDLGDVSQATYYDDPEISSYLNSLGYKLISSSSEATPDQSFEFFALKDASINAFALPGGFMGFNSGLIIAAQSESELAAVMAHEIAHVAQKHLARMIAGQKYSMIMSLASLALAIIAARSNPQAASQSHPVKIRLHPHSRKRSRPHWSEYISRCGFRPTRHVCIFRTFTKSWAFL